MKKFLSRSKPSSISGPRWASYAAAAVASASIGVSAEADIHYFVENVSLNDTDPSHAVRSVDSFSIAQAIGIGFVHDLGPSGGLAGFAMGGASAAFAGIINPTSSHQRYGLRLASNILVNAQPFIYNYGSDLAILASNAGNGLSQWSTPGTGFLAFAFNGPFGEQYGWIRLRMDSGTPTHSYTILDYAYADPDENIITGEIPEAGSLGLLALGGVGLIAWRTARARLRPQRSEIA
jgi:hypothetical protein